MADKALARNPHIATANAVKGALHVLQRGRPSNRVQLVIERPRSSRPATLNDAFGAALRHNPLIEQDRGPSIEEDRRRVAEPAR